MEIEIYLIKTYMIEAKQSLDILYHLNMKV